MWLQAVTCEPHILSLPQGHKRKNWKVRRFVLRKDPAFLHYYDPSKVSTLSSFQTCLSPAELGRFHLQPSSQPPYHNFHPRCLSFHKLQTAPPSLTSLFFHHIVACSVDSAQWIFIVLGGNTSFSSSKAGCVPTKGELSWWRDSWLVLSSLFHPFPPKEAVNSAPSSSCPHQCFEKFLLPFNI